MANEKTQTSTPKHGDAPGAKEMAESVSRDEAKGYHGVAIDPTPNHAYTVAGRIAGEPTPETDDKAAEEARKARG